MDEQWLSGGFIAVYPQFIHRFIVDKPMFNHG